MTRSRPASFKVTPGPNTARVVMTGEFDRETTKELEHELDRFLADSPSEVEFDMTAVDFIDSGGLETLFRCVPPHRDGGRGHHSSDQCVVRRGADVRSRGDAGGVQFRGQLGRPVGDVQRMA